MLRFVISLIFITLSVQLHAQKAQQNSALPQTQLNADEIAADHIIEMMDSLIAEHHYKLHYPTKQDTAKLNKYGFKPDEIPTYSPEVYEKRLKELQSYVPLDYNPLVQIFINAYVIKNRHLLSRLLGLQYVYFPIIEEVFVREGVPTELKYLAVIESALTPKAQSFAGAAGLWQFIYSTGKLHKLRIDTYIDERLDPYKSTLAAARYLKQLNAMFNKDWLLAIAAYNCGPGRVHQAIRASGGQTNFWRIRQYLPKETSNYVPLFIAATYAMSYPAEHNVYPIYADFSFVQDSLHIVNQEVSLEYIAQMINGDVELLRQLNPELRLGKIPRSTHPYALRVPAHYVTSYKQAARKKEHQKKSGLTPTNVQTTITHYHQVQRGQTPEQIAAMYEVPLDSVLAWNQIWGYKIHTGMALKLYVDPMRAANPKPVTPSTLAAATKPSLTDSSLIKRTVALDDVVSSGKTTYVIKSGDSFWSISQKTGFTIDQITRWNNLTKSSMLRPGQVLVLYKQQ